MQVGSWGRWLSYVLGVPSALKGRFNSGGTEGCTLHQTNVQAALGLRLLLLGLAAGTRLGRLEA